MEPSALILIATVAACILCITVLVSSVVLISNTRKIRKYLYKIWQNVEPFQMAQIYEFMGEKDKAIQCYKETLYNVINKKYRIAGMSRKMQIDYLESKVVALGGKLPEEG